jgi:hypothetical protein
VNSPRPHLRAYELLIQLGHTSDYQSYLARHGSSGQLYTLRQSRKEVDGVDTHPLETTLEGLRAEPHSNLPRVVDVGVEDGLLFWVSDYVEGDGLDSLGPRSLQIPTEVAVRLTLDVGAALQRLSELGGAGLVLRSDVHVGVDGRARVIPPMRWDDGLRKDYSRLAQLLPDVVPGVVQLCAFLWESLAGLGLLACHEEVGWPILSSLGAPVPPALDALLSDVIHQRARFEQLSTLATVVEQSVPSVASTEGVRDWLLGLIRARLEGRAHVLRSRYPAKPSGEIPLVRLPAGLDAVRFGVAAGPGSDTERPMPLPTIPIPQPFPGRGEEEGGPGAPLPAESGAPDGISSVPPSSIRSSSGSPDVTRRAPLESALAEYAERASTPGQRSSK